MTDGSELNEDFNAAIDDLLPEELDPSEVDPESDSEPDDAEGHRWRRIKREWHELRSVDNYRRDELVEREVEHYVDELGLSPNVREMAVQVFDQYENNQDRLVIELTAAAAVYSAAKVREAGITPDAVVQAGGDPLDRTMLLRQSKDIVNELGLDPEPFFNTDVYVDEFCEELGLSEEVSERAKQILDLCEEAEIAGGKSPTGWAGASIYLACTERDKSTSQDAVSRVADVSNVTIRNRYKEQNEVVVERECPTDIDEIIEWACTRVDLPEDISNDAKKL